MNGDNGSEGTESSMSALPLFYKDPRPLDADRHAGKSLCEKKDFSFARQTNSVPVTISEFNLISRHYPIVFSRGDVVGPVALLGLRQNENLLVDDNGEWLHGYYIPAYIRRYPFVFMESPDKERLLVCIDEASEFLVDGRKQPLFEDGEPTDTTNNALELCKAFHGHYNITIEMSKALDEAGLMTDQKAEISLNSGESMSLAGFQVIDENKFNDLPDDVFLEWRHKGWLPYIYFHLASMHNWSILVDIEATGETDA